MSKTMDVRLTGNVFCWVYSLKHEPTELDKQRIDSEAKAELTKQSDKLCCFRSAWNLSIDTEQWNYTALMDELEPA